MKSSPIILVIMLLCFNASAQEIRILVPYFGTIHNQLAVEQMDQNLDDNSLFKGLYFQWVNPKKYQWNFFLYHSKDINYSTLLGNHLILDLYFKNTQQGRYVAGIGFDLINIHTDASIIQNLTHFKMKNEIYTYYFRIGRYFDKTSSGIENSGLLWLGYQRDDLNMDLSFTIPPMNPYMPEVVVAETQNKNNHYALAGIAFKSTLYHFLEIQFKFHRKFDLNADQTLNDISLMTNLYLSRRWGISYRFKYMELVIGKNQYHIAGICFVF
ncbi:hypothetical protein JW824_12215 [bacterium]|nr:hypothetical protein [bacterium]RQV92047.1 MAG: hypothetical protein EH221_12230 [bacterium]